MLDRLHVYATKRKAPGWFLILLAALIVIYEIIDGIGNVQFVAENVGRVSWLRDYGTSPLGLLVLIVGGFAWLMLVPNPKRSTVEPATTQGAMADPSVSGTKRRRVEGLYVDYDNARWQYGGLYHLSNERPFSKPPICPAHLTGLFYEDRDGHRVTPGAATYQYFKTHGQLWCPVPASEGHGLGPHTSDTYDTMHDYAEALLLGEYNKWKGES